MILNFTSSNFSLFFSHMDMLKNICERDVYASYSFVRVREVYVYTQLYMCMRGCMFKSSFVCVRTLLLESMRVRVCT